MAPQSDGESRAAVVLVGDLPGTATQGAAMAVRAPTPGRADVPAFIDLLAYVIRERSAVLVLCPAWRSDAAHKAVRLARTALDTDRIGFLPMNLPPLALSLVADQVAYAAPYLTPGALAGLADRLTYEVCAGAWVNTVAKLEHIDVTIGMHAKSYLPGEGFAVTAAPVQRVHRISRGRPAAEIAHRPGAPVLMLVSHVDGDLEWVRGRLAPALAVNSLTIVGPQPESPSYWGAKKYAEFVAFSGHPQTLQATLAATTFRPCGWCGEATALLQCSFCGMAQPQRPHPAKNQSATIWPYPARPSEAIARSPSPDQANVPHSYETPSPLACRPGTADRPAASEGAHPDREADRPDRIESASSTPQGNARTRQR